MSAADVLSYCAKLVSFGEPKFRRRARSGLFVNVATIFIVTYVGLEIVVRLAGLGSFPVYVRDSAVGYYLMPNQHGVFLDRIHWFVNSDGFVNDRDFTDSHPSSLLVGDSIVYGGNPVDWDCRVGTLAGKYSRRATWVAAAGGWNLLNELAFLEQYRRIVGKVDRLIFVLNSGDFGEAGQWTGELAFPTRHPLSLFPYLIRRYLLAHPAELPPVNITATGQTWQPEFDRLLRASPERVTIILYPDRADYSDKSAWAQHTAAIRQYGARHRNLKFVDLTQETSWRGSYYSDGIHPTCAGNHALAGIVAAAELR